MTNLLATIAPKSDQLNADDLIGATKTIRVTRVSLCKEPDQPIAISFEGDNGKPYKPCKSMRRVLVNIWGGDGNLYAGRSMTLYRDDKVQFGGMAVGGIRISHMSDMQKEVTMALTATRANRKPYTVRPLPTDAAVRSNASPPAAEVSHRYPTLFGVKDGRVWLSNLATTLGAAQSEDEITEIRGLSSVTKTMQSAPPAIQDEISGLFAGAMTRVRSADTEGLDFGDGDAAPETSWGDAGTEADDTPATDPSPPTDALSARVATALTELENRNRTTLPDLQRQRKWKDFMTELELSGDNAQLVRVRVAVVAASMREPTGGLPV